MYEVKPYKDGGTESATTYYGVYEKCNYTGYKKDNGLDNLVVFCHSEAIAKAIAELLSHDYEQEMKDL